MYTTTMTQPDPQRFMDQFTSWEAATKENKWQGRNITRWKNEEYDKTWRAAEAEMDPVKRAVLFIKMNDLRHPGHRRDPGDLARVVPRSANKLQDTETERLGRRLLEPGQLVSRGVELGSARAGPERVAGGQAPGGITPEDHAAVAGGHRRCRRGPPDRR